jgi:hypothetical protein
MYTVEDTYTTVRKHVPRNARFSAKEPLGLSSKEEPTVSRVHVEAFQETRARSAGFEYSKDR